MSEEQQPIDVVLEVDGDGNWTLHALDHPVQVTLLDYGLGELDEQDRKVPHEVVQDAELIRGMALEQVVAQIKKENA